MARVEVSPFATLLSYHPGGGDGCDKGFTLKVGPTTNLLRIYDILGIPLQEVKMNFVNNRHQAPDYQVQEGDRIAIFPPPPGDDGQREVCPMEKTNGQRCAGKSRANPQIREEIEGGLFLHRPSKDLEQVYLEVTTRCNLNCITCIRNNWEDPGGDLSLDLYNRLLQQLAAFPRLKTIHFGGFGEPLVHPHLLSMVISARDAGYSVKISSNGMLLDNKLAQAFVKVGVREIIVSCDSPDLREFAHIRTGGNLRLMEQNLLGLTHLKRRVSRRYPRISLEFVLMKQNLNQLNNLPPFAQRVGASHVLVTNLLPYTQNMVSEILYDDPPLISISQEYWVSPEITFAPRFGISLPRMQWGAARRCNFIENRTISIAWDGRVSPCYPLLHPHTCYVFGRKKDVSSYTLGNVADTDLIDIYYKPEYVKFRNRVRLFQFPSCVDCELKETCDFPAANEDCWGANPSCADCLWAQNIIRCP